MNATRRVQIKATNLSRRQWFASTGLACGSGLMAVGPASVRAADEGHTPDEAPIRYCLNMATIRGQGLSVAEEVDVAAKAGYDAIEPWIRKVEQYEEQGGNLKDLAKRIQDSGLTVESAIGFANWIVDDQEQRAKGLESAKRDMDCVRRIGGTRMAAPPAGANRTDAVSLDAAAERYHVLLELGIEIGVVPQLEIWGSSTTLSRLGEAMYVAAESRHPKACLLLDVYHLYKGGTDFSSLQLLSGQAMHVFHMNDYPADPPRETIKDSDRVYPGDGIAPLDDLIHTLCQNGFRGIFSLELFNRAYWQRDPLEVARTGLEKMKRVVRTARRA